MTGLSSPIPHTPVGEFAAGLSAEMRDWLRAALENRQEALVAALRLYEEVSIKNAPRMALVHKTQVGLAEIRLALAELGDPRYGTCTRCGVTLPLEALARLPLATHCARCEASFSA